MDEKTGSLDDERRQLYAPVKREETAFHLWQEFDPALARTFSEFFVGGIYKREVISQRDRELCAVAALTVLRAQDELRLHVHAARNRGATKEEITEVIFQMVTYGGAPAVVQGLRTAKAAFIERGEWEPAKT
jgi:4-carboxymuconolactone decarboxylase